MTDNTKQSRADAKEAKAEAKADEKEAKVTAKANEDAAEDAADAQAEAFETEQKGRQARFDRDQEAFANTNARRVADAKEKAEARAALAARQQENDELSYRHGYLTDADLPARTEFVRQHGHECLWPHQAVIDDDEDLVKMPFPRNMILNLHSPEPDTTIHTGHKVMFLKGYNDVPESISDHPYLYDNGVRRTDKDGKPEPEKDRLARVKDKQAKADKAADKADKADAKAAKSKE